MASAREWLQGKKTVFGGCVVIAAAAAGAWTGKMSVLDAVTVAGMGFSICGWSAKANRHQSELLTALEQVAIAGAEMRAGQRAAAIQTVTDSLARQAVRAAAEEVPSK